MCLQTARLWLAVACLFAAGSLLSPAAMAQQDESLVRVDPVRSEPLSQTVPVVGRLVARQAGLVAAKNSGPILEFRVEVGDRVSAGDVIAVLDGVSMGAERDLAAAELTVAQAVLNTKQAQVTLARQELQRLERLKQSAAFSQARFEDARQEVAIAEAGAREAEASVVSARASLRLADINLEDMEVQAPYDGVISQRLSEAGAYASDGDALVRMIADKSMEVEADVPANRLLGLTQGAAVEVVLDDGTLIGATVRAIIPDENPLTRTRAVRFIPRFGEITTPLANEQSVTVMVPIGAPRQIVSVHKDAIIKRPDGTMVFVVSDGHAQPRPITLGEAVGNRYEVVQGLAEGEQTVVRGNERLRPGATVRIDGET
ncbi:efflux RND transporter periplasmic adaptor subunit [Pelagibius litoralis]|uniref:Efflux RND transporter periplasmic adaptor subunit n=1 Tax=Pelagibius litoralis TaxID=374515 RepID=A0A967KG76_9PROT|nr:efflux RND transporter periplasmic adaptor subunit [Pelagibius litoralis]NIA70126.1 efflux RND transporter periplasmic adaptor subunit [Pelagibius litoralis]